MVPNFNYHINLEKLHRITGPIRDFSIIFDLNINLTIKQMVLLIGQPKSKALFTVIMLTLLNK